VKPIDDGCGDDAVCHAALRLDYLTLGSRGYALRSGPLNSVDAAGAETAARSVFDANGQRLDNGVRMSGAAGVYLAFVEPLDFGAFALVGAQSGLVIAAGGVVWSGTGRYWLPLDWKPAADIAYGGEPAVVEGGYADVDRCEAPSPSRANDAMDLALRTNLAQAFAARGSFSAYVFLYTPRVGVCDPSVAEYIVVFSQKRH
jgi:hypothetical protein